MLKSLPLSTQISSSLDEFPCKLLLNSPSRTGKKMKYELCSLDDCEFPSLASMSNIWVSIGMSLPEFPTRGIIHQILNLYRNSNLTSLHHSKQIFENFYCICIISSFIGRLSRIIYQEFWLTYKDPETSSGYWIPNIM